MDRRTIGLIWAGGFVLMILVYLVGPQHFIAACELAIANAVRWLSELLDTLVVRALEVVRAAAIALYGVFLVLAVLAMQRRLRAGGMFVVVTVVFLVLAHTDWYGRNMRWLAAAVLIAVADVVLTKRLIHTPRPRDPADPWGVGMRGGNQSGSPRTPSEPPP